MKKIIFMFSLMFILVACSSGDNGADEGISGFFGKEPVKDVTIQAFTLSGEKLGEAVKTGVDGRFNLSIPTGQDIIIKVIDNSVKVENFVGAVALPSESKSTFDFRNANLAAAMNGWQIFVPANTKALFTPLSVAASKAATGATNAEKIKNYQEILSNMVTNLSCLSLALAPQYALTKDEILNGEYNPNLEFALQTADLLAGGRTGTYDENYYNSLVNIPASRGGLGELYPTINPDDIVANARLLADNLAKAINEPLEENDAAKIAQLENTIVMSTIVNSIAASAYSFTLNKDSTLKMSYRDIVVPTSTTGEVYKYSATALGFTAKNYTEFEETEIQYIKLCRDKLNYSNTCEELDQKMMTLVVPATNIDRVVITEVNKGLSYDLPITKEEFLKTSVGYDEHDSLVDFYKDTKTKPFFRLNLKATEEEIGYFIEMLADYSGQKVTSSMTVRVGTERTETDWGGFDELILKK